jgi:hypothetical protein
VAKIVPGKRYTKEQLQLLVDQAEADELKMQGYVLQYDVLSGTYGVVHWTHAGGAEDFGSVRKPRIAHDPAAFTKPEPIKKRTPMERVDSLMLRFIDDCKRAGTVPLMGDDRISLIIGEAWRAGRSEITGEVIRKVAADFLQKAENKQRADDFKKVADLKPTT